MPRKLLFSVGPKDFKVQTFCAGGPGGQHQNAKQTGVRIIHKDSGARGEARDERSQKLNKRKALSRLVESKEFMRWHRAKVYDMLAASDIEERVAKAMKEVRVEQYNHITEEWEPEDRG